MNKFNLLSTIYLLVVSTSAYSLQATNNDHSDESHEKRNSIELIAEQQQLAGITTEPLQLRPLGKLLVASGEVKANGYTSYFVSPRVQSVVIKRHAILGEQVVKGQPLVTLFSEVVAQIQADYRIAHADWQRVKNLSSAQAVSEQQKLASKTKLAALNSQLKAYGIESNAILAIIKDETLPLGEYQLTAQRGGSVLSDDFHQGQGVESGETIMVLSDESQLWIEARLPATNKTELPKGTKAQVVLGKSSYLATVIQAAHTIDSTTRTRVIRLLVDNTDHQLHAGLFVDVIFSVTAKNRGYAVPQTALMRSNDGDWQIFVEEKNDEFVAIEVLVGDNVFLDNNANVWNEIIAANDTHPLLVGERIVTEGAFFLSSELAKSGFDIHNH